MLPLYFLFLFIQIVLTFNIGWTFTALPPSETSWSAFYVQKEGTETVYNFLPGFIGGTSVPNIFKRSIIQYDNGTFSSWYDGVELGYSPYFYQNIVPMYNKTFLYGGSDKDYALPYTALYSLTTENGDLYEERWKIPGTTVRNAGSYISRKWFATAPMEDGKFFIYGGSSIYFSVT